MTGEELNPKVLGQLLLMQSVLNNLPDNKSIFSFVCKGLLDIPGISKVSYSETRTTKDDNLPSQLIFPITLSNSYYGELNLTLSDINLYKPYEHYLTNFIFMIGVILEERKQRQIIEEHKQLLEHRVKERTHELNLEKENLAESQRRFTELMVNVKLLSVMLDVNGNIVFCNNYLLNLAQYTSDEILGKNWFDLFLPKNIVGQIKTVFYGLMKGADFAYNYENEILAKDGKTLIVSWNNTILRDANKQIIGTASIGENITQRKRDELLLKEKTDEIEAQNEEYLQINEELNQTNIELQQAKERAEESHQLFYSLFHQAAVGVAIINSETGLFIQINKKYCQICGYTENEMLEADFMSITHPNDLELDLSNMRSLKKGEINEFSIDKRYIKKDNSTIWIRLTVSPLEKKADSILTHIAIVEDISDRKRFELELEKARQKDEENESRFRAIFENSSDAIGISKGGINVFFNKAYLDLFGFSNERMIVGKSVLEQIAPKEQARIAKYIQNRISCIDVPTFYETIGITKDGREFPFEVTIGTYNMNSENYTIAIIRDITQRKRAEIELIIAKEKAEESDRLKTAFLQNMSHEIRTPLNAISGFSGMLNKAELSDYKRKSFVSIIQSSSQQLISVVSDILTISSLETKQEKVNFSKVCINDIVVDLLSIFRQQSVNKNISLYARQPLSNRQSEIYTDKTKITQILTNLLSNALKFTPEGTIEFGYELITDLSVSARPDSILRFYVKDSGIGIKPEFHEKIFERFRQADQSISKLYGGTGLGLAISKAFVDLLEGRIWVESEAEKGSVFYFTIPYKPINEIDINNSPTKQIENFRTVLVAEDEEYNYLFIEELLIDMDLKLIHSKDGLETVEICKANSSIDLILMDIKMPIMNGYIAAGQIKEFRPGLPIIAQSAYALEHEIEKYKGIFDDYVTKPIDESELKKKIAKYFKILKETGI